MNEWKSYSYNIMYVYAFNKLLLCSQESYPHLYLKSTVYWQCR